MIIGIIELLSTVTQNPTRARYVYESCRPFTLPALSLVRKSTMSSPLFCLSEHNSFVF